MFLHPAINASDSVSIIALQLLRESYFVLSEATSILTRLEQLAKAHQPMLITEFGMVRLFRPVKQNAYWPMLVTELGMSIFVRPVEPLNAQSSMLITEFGIIVFLHPIINLFDFVSIIALQLLRESYFVFSETTLMLARLEQSANILNIDNQSLTL